MQIQLNKTAPIKYSSEAVSLYFKFSSAYFCSLIYFEIIGAYNVKTAVAGIANAEANVTPILTYHYRPSTKKKESL